MPRILITCIQMQETASLFADTFRELGWTVEAPPVAGQQLPERDLIRMLPGVVGVIAGDDPFSRTVLESAPDLRAISKWGVGVDGIDLHAAREFGVKVDRTPFVFGDEVADVAIAYVIGLTRRLFEVDRSVRSGNWLKPRGVSLAGRTAALIGLGDIGRGIARRLMACRITVRAVDPASSASIAAKDLGLNLWDLDSAVQNADFLIIACPLNSETRGLVNLNLMQRLSENGYVVNVGRGPIVVEDDLVVALDQGIIAGAALDVFEVEPLSKDHPFTRMENVVLGSHNASNSHEAVLRASRSSIENLAMMLKDE